LTDDRRGAGDTAYSVLGVRHDANDADIAAAYRSLARVYHPDVAGESGTVRMSRINAAFDRLRDPGRRDAYDRELGIYPVRRAPRTRPSARHTAAPHATAPTAATPTSQAAAPHGSRRRRDGTGAAGPPPGRPSGTVLQFGRHVGWSIGEVARIDPGYLEWLEVHREGAAYLDEIDETLVRVGYRSAPRRPRPKQEKARRSWRRR
jgi:curved DNA-binding protein CbpA